MNKRRTRIYTSATFKVVVAVFYAASLLIGIFPDLVSSERIGLEQISWGLAAAAGVAIVALTKQCNVWALLLVGFVQPLFVIVRTAIEIPHVLQLGLSLWPSLQIGAACAAGGWVVSVATSGLKAGDFSLSDCRKWILPAWGVLTRTEKVESVIKTLLTVGSLALGVLNLLWRP